MKATGSFGGEERYYRSDQSWVGLFKQDNTCCNGKLTEQNTTAHSESFYSPAVCPKKCQLACMIVNKMDQQHDRPEKNGGPHQVNGRH
jgi:hypothetical protein